MVRGSWSMDHGPQTMVNAPMQTNTGQCTGPHWELSILMVIAVLTFDSSNHFKQSAIRFKFISRSYLFNWRQPEQPLRNQLSASLKYNLYRLSSLWLSWWLSIPFKNLFWPVPSQCNSLSHHCEGWCHSLYVLPPGKSGLILAQPRVHRLSSGPLSW